MRSYKAVAKFFATLSQKTETEFEANEMTHLKLQKLLYYAQGWALVDLGYALFHNEIRAWEHGPVVVEAYHDLKQFGKNTLLPESIDAGSEELTEDEKQFLTKVYDVYGIYSAWGLRELTHEEDPWKNNHPFNEIKEDDLKVFFQKIKDNETQAN